MHQTKIILSEELPNCCFDLCVTGDCSCVTQQEIGYSEIDGQPPVTQKLNEYCKEETVTDNAAVVTQIK